MRRIKGLRSKIKDQSGESILEVLVSLLICVLSLAMLTTMITTSTKITKKSEETMKKYYDATADVARMSQNSEGKTCYATISRDGTEEKYTYKVTYFVNKEGIVPVISYSPAAADTSAVVAVPEDPWIG